MATPSPLSVRLFVQLSGEDNPLSGGTAPLRCSHAARSEFRAELRGSRSSFVSRNHGSSEEATAERAGGEPREVQVRDLQV